MQRVRISTPARLHFDLLDTESQDRVRIDFEKVTVGCRAPITIVRGPKCETDRETLTMIRGALDGGAAGMVVRRNIWQREYPIPIIEAIPAYSIRNNIMISFESL